MGAFSDLMLEARKLGAAELNFNVNLNGFMGNVDVPRWSCRCKLDASEKPVPNHAVGRTGEEALRECVTFLRMTAGP